MSNERWALDRLGFHKCISPFCIEFEFPFYRALFARVTLYISYPLSVTVRFWNISMLLQDPWAVWASSSSTAFANWAIIDDPSLVHGLVMSSNGGFPWFWGLRPGSLHRSFPTFASDARAMAFARTTRASTPDRVLVQSPEWRPLLPFHAHYS